MLVVTGQWEEEVHKPTPWLLITPKVRVILIDLSRILSVLWCDRAIQPIADRTLIPSDVACELFLNTWMILPTGLVQPGVDELMRDDPR
jgi:hypothetical protein